MTDLDIRADGEHRYRADLTTDDGTSHEHTVEVPETLLAELNLETADEPLLVRAALELLLEHPELSVPATFRLGDSEVTYPGFLEQLRAAAGR